MLLNYQNIETVVNTRNQNFETKISMAEMDINSEDKKIKEVSKALHNSEVLAVQRMQSEKEKSFKNIGKLEDALQFNLFI